MLKVSRLRSELMGGEGVKVKRKKVKSRHLTSNIVPVIDLKNKISGC